MEKVVCNLCGSGALRHVYSMPDVHFHPNEWFDTVECTECGLGFVNPRPSFEEMSRYYPAEFYNYFDTEHEYHARRYAAEAAFLGRASNGVTNPRLLDVGCANGDFPRYMMSLGWSVEGVEVSPNSRKIEDFPVHRVDFTKIGINSPRFDAVTAWAVMEHVHDPMAYFAKAAEVLKPGGLFVFLVTNFESLSSRALFGEDPPRHLYFFTQSTVEKYLARFGFELERVDYSDRVYAMHADHFLRYAWRRLTGRPLRWDDLPETKVSFMSRHAGRSRGAVQLLYAWKYPLTTIERVLRPLVERYQMMTKSYGIVTFVARKK